MIGLKKDIKIGMKKVAKTRGISLKEFRAEIQDNIYAMMESDAPEVQENFRKIFGNNIPTPEEYFYRITKSTMKKIKI